MPFEDLLEENKPLAPLTTLGVGGRARWFLEATREEHVAMAAAWAREKDIRLLFLGGGSNLVISDAGFDGIVVHIALRGIDVAAAVPGARQITWRVAAGEDWDHFVQRTVDQNCAGIECLAGIPGTVGGTPVQNVGAYGQEVSSTIAHIRAFDLATHTWEELASYDCRFSYRRSRFNTAHRGRYIITRVDFRLTPGGAPTLTYADLQREFAPDSHPTLAEVAATVRRIRQAKGMLLVEGDPDCRSAGSFFKNPVVTEESADHIAEIGGDKLPRYPAGEHGKVKIPAAWLIARAGFKKGYTRGAAGISSRHPLALINRGGATAKDILSLAGEIKSAVRSRFTVSLEMEPVLVGLERI